MRHFKTIPSTPANLLLAACASTCASLACVAVVFMAVRLAGLG